MFGLYKENKRIFDQNLDLKIINHCIRLLSLDHRHINKWTALRERNHETDIDEREKNCWG